MTWMVDFADLDQVQRTYCDTALQPGYHCFSTGPAGVGKTVFLVHIMLKYRELHPSNKIAMVLYTRSLIDMIQSAIPQEKAIRYFTTFGFERNHEQWDLIAVDEIQDVKENVLKKIINQTTKVLIAGDFFQSIYEHSCSLQDIGTQGFDIKKFEIIYRLTHSIRRVASLFSDNPQDFLAYPIDKRVNNTSVLLVKNRDRSSDLLFVWKKACALAEASYSTAVILPSNGLIQKFANFALNEAGQSSWALVSDHFGKPDYNNLNQTLRHHKLPLQIIGNGAGSMHKADAENLVSVMTYHNAKGLDFEAVFIPCLDNNTTIWNSNSDIERRLFFVALTRCRQDLFLSYSGNPHQFLLRIPENYLQIQDRTQFIENDDIEDDDFDSI